MSDSTMLLAVFEDIEPASSGIEKLHEMGITDDQMNVISGIPVKNTILDRPSALSYVSRIAFTGAILGFLLGVFLIWGLRFFFLCMSADSRSIRCHNSGSSSLR